MPSHPIRRRSCLVLALMLVGLAVFFSRTVLTHPSAATPEKAGAALLTAVGCVQPRLAADAKHVVFSYQGAIWRYGIESQVMRRLTAGAGFAVEPCWSPDGKHIAYLQGRYWGTGRLKLIEADNGQAVALPGDGDLLSSGALQFTPDGQRLLGFLRKENQVEALRALDLKTGKLETVLRGQSSRQPWCLSGDGKWIAFASTLDVPGEQSGNDGPQNDVWKVPAGGGEPERIVRFPARIHGLCWVTGDRSLIASAELGGPHNDLWRIDLADPERPVKLTFGQADEDRPSVSKNLLLYSDNHQGCPAMVLHDLALGATRTLPIQKLDFGVATGRLVVEGSREKASVVRVALEAADGSSHAPPGSLWRVFRDFGHFYVRDQAELDLPAGAYRLRTWHGPESRALTAAIDVRAGEKHRVDISCQRWADPNSRGWYSGENHIHANYGYGEYYNSPKDMADMIAGENLNIGNFMVANSDGDGVFDREFFRGRPDPLSTPKNLLYWNEEYRSTIWGHMTLVNLKQVVEPVFTGFKDTTNPYDIPTMSGIAERTHRQGGLVNYTHPASVLDDLYRGPYSAKGLPIHAALGQIDTMDVMGSGDQASSAYYHRLLNCGFRLAASAGTDCFLNRIRSWLPGGERAYVKIDGPLTYEKWIAGLKAGRSFVSNGPILTFSVNDTGLGETLDLGTAQEVQVRAAAASQFPLDRVEVLYNGKVVAAAVPERDQITTQIDRKTRLDRSGWLALRAAGKAVPDVKGEAVYAHTSPVYVIVGGKPAGSADDARYFLKWIDRLWTTVQERDRIPGEFWKSEVQKEVDRARKVYQQIIDQSAEN